jgi:hypothetical protein
MKVGRNRENAVTASANAPTTRQSRYDLMSFKAATISRGVSLAVVACVATELSAREALAFGEGNIAN